MDIHIIAEQLRWNKVINLYLVDKSFGKMGMVKDILFETVPEGEVFPETPINLSYTAAQELMDSLWECGLRPSEGSGSAGSLLATQNHLKDMQSLSWRLLAMIEKDDK